VRIEEGGGRILLGDNTGGGAVMIGPISFSVCWSLDFKWSPSYIRRTYIAHSVPSCAKLDLLWTFPKATISLVEDSFHS